MRRPLGLTLIITFYAFIGGLTLALSFFQLLSVNNYGMKLIFIDPCLELIAENTILTIEILASLPESIILMLAFIATFITSMFHTLLAESLYRSNSKAYSFGILFHSYSALSSFALWMLGINTLKLIGVFFLFMNLIKATYLYINRVRGGLPKNMHAPRA
jgi:hypothetical protein